MKNSIAAKLVNLTQTAFVPDPITFQKKGNDRVVASVMVTFHNLGFILDRYSYDVLRSLTTPQIVSVTEAYLPILKKMVGADHNYQPFYKNFPDELIGLDDIDLYTNAMFHYWSNGTWEPDSMSLPKYKFENHTSFKPLKMRHMHEFPGVLAIALKKLICSAQPIVDEDRAFIDQAIKQYPDVMEELDIESLSIPLKENLVLLMDICDSYHITIKPQTVTDVLRYAVQKSKGDFTLTERLPFKKFNRKARRRILWMVDQFKGKGLMNVADEMRAHKAQWLRLGEKIHPGEYKKSYPFAFQVFDALRNKKIISWQGKVDNLIREGKIAEAVKMLSQRPGIFARQLDFMIRESGQKSNLVIREFIDCADKVSVPVLVQLYSHFKKRAKMKDNIARSLVVRPMKTPKMIERELKPIDIVDLIAIKSAIKGILMRRFFGYECLGNVAIDSSLKNIPVPSGMRDINAGIRTMIRGSRIPLGDQAVIRAYVHWLDKKGRQDVDLSCTFLDKNFNSTGTVAYHDLRMGKANNPIAVHSGDVRYHRGACAEYIDVNIELARAHGHRYVVIDVRNYENLGMCDVDQCVGGFMMRDSVSSATKNFVPKSIENAVPLAGKGISSIMCAIDLETREYVWIDLNGDTNMAVFDDVLSPAVQDLVNATTNQMTLYTLLNIHTDARALMTSIIDTEKESTEEYDTVFGPELAFDYALIQSEYMK